MPGRSNHLALYRKKRRFNKTPEPKGSASKSLSKRQPIFVIQKHAARRLHYDFRLEMNGVLKSWAVPKGPSLDPEIKRLAVHVEDHPIEYANFEGIIPKGEYGGGSVIIWDQGYWQSRDKDPASALSKGRVHFTLFGKKLKGQWVLFKTQNENWLLKKLDDAYSDSRVNIVDKAPQSVVSRRKIEELEEGKERIWTRKGEMKNPQINKKINKHSADPFPSKIEPELARLTTRPPSSKDWIHEIKWDGYRILAKKSGDDVRLYSRQGLDWTSKFPEIAKAIKKLKVSKAWLDGEVVAFSEGKTHFKLLVEHLHEHKTQDLQYCVFDLLYSETEDLRPIPLIERKARLAELFSRLRDARLRLSDHFEVNSEAFFKASCSLKLEGMISKQKLKPYRSGRNGDWVKVKCVQEEEFIIIGYTASKSSEPFGSLLLAQHPSESKRDLIYSGKVGTGFTHEEKKQLVVQFKSLAQGHPLYERIKIMGLPKFRNVYWIDPKLVAEIQYSERSTHGLLRHPAFIALRDDKNSKEVEREKAMSPKRISSKKTFLKDNKLLLIHGVKITHPDKILYSGAEVTKRDLAEYYDRVWKYASAHMVERPLMIVRCPEGESKSCFFQKHPGPAQKVLADSESNLKIESLDDLMKLIQLGAVEFHGWGSNESDLEHPDRIVFDFDPDPDLPFKKTIQAAQRLKQILKDRKLTSFVKTTGGKGLHIVVPIRPELSWGVVKAESKNIVEQLRRENPEAYVTRAFKKERTGRIYLDYLRNGRGSTSVCAFSPRAKPSATVSFPVDWQQLEDRRFSNALYTIESVQKILKGKWKDPWAGFFKFQNQSLFIRSESRRAAKG